MAIFGTIYNAFIAPAEGGYVNDPLDAGKETYAGISRVNFPTWSGWPIIDTKKVAGQPIKTNTKFPELTPKVTAFYNALWNANNFGLIKSQDVAGILFDWFINSGYLSVSTTSPETFGVDEILNRDFGYSLPKDSRFDSATINAINAVDPVKLYTIIKSERKKFYESIVKAKPSHQKFLAGWFARINKFPDLVTAGKLSLISIIVIVLVLVVISNK